MNNWPKVTNIVVKQIYNGRWISYGILDDNRNIMTSVSQKTQEESLKSLIDFAKRLKNE